MLRSPKASEGSGGALGEAEALRRGNTVGVRDQVMDLVAGQGLKVSRQSDNLLPTPDAYSADRGGSQNPIKRRAGGHQVTLADETEKGEEVSLLPTPVTTDAAGARNATANRSNPHSRHHSGTTLTDALLPTVTASLVASGGSSSPNWKRNRGSQVTLKDEIEKGDDVKNLTLLPTPTVVDMGGNKTPDEWEAWTDEQRAKHSNGNGHGASLNIEAVKLMPTPNTMDHLPPRSAEKIAESKRRTPGGYANIRETVVNDLLPTPSAAEEPGFTTEPVDKNGEPTENPNERWYHPETGRLMQKGIMHAVTINWGKFAPAIERWEVMTGRPAPAATKPDGKENAHRLSSEFTEWMMGLPAGWITGVGLSRNEELKACGNGVVPQQAELALRMLLEGLLVERERERTVMLPTPTVSDIYTGDLASTQQKPGSMHSVTLPQAVRMVDGVE